MKDPFEIMPDQEHYSLRWNNHQNHILRAFDTLLQTKTLVDVTLVSAETSIRAHKVVLSACSPFFQRVFSETPCKHPVIVLKDFRGWVVQAIVDFMYRGEISVPQERLSVLIQAGESLQVRGLVDHPIAANTPTPAQSPEDFSILENSLVSPTLPSPTSPNCLSSQQPNLRHLGTNSGSAVATNLLSSRTPKLLMSQQVFSDPSIGLSNIDPCTSPMPRRKQARPRRRSGEFAPQDLSSKPSTPQPFDNDDKEGNNDPELLEDHPEDEDDIEELEDDDDDDLKHILHRSRSEDGKLGGIEEQDDLTKTCSNATGARALSGDRQAHSLHKSAPRQASSCQDDAVLPNVNRDSLQQATTPVPEGPENLCMKKSSPSGSDKVNHAMCSGGEPRDQRSGLPSTDDPNTHDFKANTDCRPSREDSSTRLSDGSKDRSSLSESVSGSNNLTTRGLLSLKDIRHLNRTVLNRRLGSISPPPSFSSFNTNLQSAMSFMHHHHSDSKRVKLEEREDDRSLLHDDMEPPHFLDHMDLALGTHQHPLAHHIVQQHHHMHNAPLQLRPPLADTSNDNNNSNNKHSNSIDHQHLQSGNPNSKQQTPSTGRPATPTNAPAGGGTAGGNGSSNGNNNSSSNNNNNSNPNHSHHHALHPGGPKGSASGGPKDFLHSPTLNFPPFFNHSDVPPRPPHSPLPFPHMPSVSSLTLTPPHMFGLDSPLGLFPPGMDPGKIYSPLMEMSDPRAMHHEGPPFLKKKMNRPKGQHSAPRGGPPRSWTNAELTEALQHVWNKKMTTSQASRIFGIPYNSLLMYVRGKYGKSLKLEQLRKDCISGPPIELLQMGAGNNNNKDKKDPKDNEMHNHHSAVNAGREGSNGPNGGNGGSSNTGVLGPNDFRGPRSASSEPELLSSSNPLFNPFPGGFYPDFPGGFPGLPLSMLNLLPPERHQPHTLSMSVDEDCKSDRSRHSMDDDFPQPLALNRPSSQQLVDGRRELYQQNGQD